MIPKSAPRTAGNFLRKDYAFIFERYFYLLEDSEDEAGLIVFDGLSAPKAICLWTRCIATSSTRAEDSNERS